MTRPLRLAFPVPGRKVPLPVEHYHLERNHQGLANRLIDPGGGPLPGATGIIHCRERLGGLLRYYHREAA